MKKLLTRIQAVAGRTISTLDHHVQRKVCLAAVSAVLVLPSTAVHAESVWDALRRVENKVNTIRSRVTTTQTKVNSIVNSTDGLEDLISNVQDITTNFDPELIGEVKASLQQAKDLMDFVRTRSDAFAYNPEVDLDDDDIVTLIFNLQETANILVGDGNNLVNFELLETFLNFVPLKPLQRLLSEVGINKDFLDQFGVILEDLAELANLSKQIELDQIEPCSYINEELTPLDRRILQEIAFRVENFGAREKLLGSMLSALKGTVEVANKRQAGVHGYAHINIDTDLLGAIGGVLAASGEEMCRLASRMTSAMERCDDLTIRQMILDNQESILIRLEQ